MATSTGAPLSTNKPEGTDVASTAIKTTIAAAIQAINDYVALDCKNTLTTAGDTVYASAAKTLARLAKGTARQQLAMNSGATAPEWVASLQSLLTAEGDTLYASAANTPARLAKGTANQLLRMNAGATAPEWASTLAGLTLTSPIIGTQVSFSDAASKIVPGATSISLRNNADSADNLLVTDAGVVTARAGLIATAGNSYIGDTANAKMTQGLTINQGAEDDEILALKSSDVAHGMTDVTETDTYAVLRKVTSTTGGALLRGFTATGGDKLALLLEGYIGDAAGDTTKSTAARGVVEIKGGLKSAAGTAALGANENILVIRTGNGTGYIFDTEGSAHADVEWTTFDSHDDVALLHALDAAMTKDPVKTEFGRYLSDYREQLQAAKIVNFYNPDGPRAMVNFTRLSMLLVGAVRQLGDRLQIAEGKLAQLPAGR